MIGLHILVVNDFGLDTTCDSFSYLIFHCLLFSLLYFGKINPIETCLMVEFKLWFLRLNNYALTLIQLPFIGQVNLTF